MKCTKCNSTDLIKIKALPIKISVVKLINPYYKICKNCGYTEMWIDKDAIEKLK